jgi:hypothetical protein
MSDPNLTGHLEHPEFAGDPAVGVLDLVDDQADAELAQLLAGRAGFRAAAKPTFADDLKRALDKYLPGQVRYVSDWRTRGDSWDTPNGRPLAHLHHHTAGAATDSTDPKHKGNQPGANDGVIAFCINRHGGKGLPNTHGFCNAILDRDGTVVIVGALAQWHAGLGDFTGTRWAKLGVQRNRGNRQLFGTEIISKGMKKDLTAAQKRTAPLLTLALKEACGWPGVTYRTPNHKDYARGRKSDTRYSWVYWRARAAAAWLARRRSS